MRAPPNLVNLTSFAAVSLPMLTAEGRQVLVVCVAGRFGLPAPGKASPEPPAPSEHQAPPPLEDVWWGEPGASSLRLEGQSTWHRPGTDIYLLGQAWAPGGRPARESAVSIQVGPCRRVLRACGPRYWAQGLVAMKPSEPEPFTCIPLRYELAWGGPTEPRNPVGRGLHGSAREAREQPLPQLESPDSPVRGPTETVEPAGVGPVARTWLPRRALAGTYDQAWRERRAPLWPLDFDPRFFLAAAPGLYTHQALQGGEPVVLSGLSPDGSWSFPLPRRRLLAKATFRRRVERREMRLDGVLLEPEAQSLTLYWRAAIPAHRELNDHESSLVRELEPWEQVA